MIPQEYIELMQREIDDENSPEQSRRLHAYLSAHSSARALYQELCAAVSLLEQSPRLSPPASLRRRCLDAIAALDAHAAVATQPAAAVARAPSVATARRTSSWRSRQAAAFAWGFVLCLTLTGAAWLLVASREPVPTGELTGAIFGRRAQESFARQEITTLALPGVTGRLQIAPVGDGTHVRLELVSDRAVHLRWHGPGHIICNGLLADGDALLAVDVQVQSFRLTHHGSATYEIVLQHPDALVFEIGDDDGVLFTKAIKREHSGKSHNL
jgi:hypothetical protein